MLEWFYTCTVTKYQNFAFLVFTDFTYFMHINEVARWRQSIVHLSTHCYDPGEIFQVALPFLHVKNAYQVLKCTKKTLLSHKYICMQ